MRIPLVAAAALVAAAMASTHPSAQRNAAAPLADLVIVNGRVYTSNATGAFAEAVAVRGRLVAAVGSSADIARLQGPRTTVIDAGGRAVVPGFNDVHTHILNGGLEMDNVDLQGASSLDDVQERIRTFAAEHPERAWVVGRGWGYGPFPNSAPNGQQLDAAVSDRPAAMRCFDGHSLWVNSRALAAAGITRDTPDPPNGTIVRNPATNEPTGWLKETPAMELVTRVIPKPTREEQRRGLKQATELALRNGVTSVTDAAGTADGIEVIDEARRAGDLRLRIYYSLLIMPGFAESDADRFDAIWKQHPDTPLLKTGIVKMFLDGVIETNTAFMLAPYTNVPSRGTPNYAPEEFQRIVTMMDQRGWQIMVHGLGDGAVRMALDAYEKLASTPAPARGRRHRIEHIETIDLADIPRFGRLGVIASMHPGGGFTPANVEPQARPGAASSGAWATNLGPERVARGGMWKSISEAGGQVVFGSDWPVAPLDAMARITSIAHRPPRPGGLDQRLSIAKAIDDYTSGAAYAAFDEKQKGTIAPGMLADLVILASDVFKTPPVTREAAAVYATIFDGRVAYRARGN